MGDVIQPNSLIAKLIHMNSLTFTFAVILLFSCSNTPKNNRMEAGQTIESVSQENEIRPIEEQLPATNNNEFTILLPGEYRDWEGENAVNELTKDWFHLYQKDGEYYLGKSEYSIQRGYSECSGDSTKILNAKKNTLLFIDGPNLESGEISTLKIKKNKIWPNENFKFKFGDTDYTLRAEGTILSSEKVHTDNGVELFQSVENYKLYISINNSKETLFLEQESFNDTFVELLFIGDIDKDGKADFIFSANRDYEEERVLLYFSSKGKPGEIIKKVAEVAIQFDC